MTLNLKTASLASHQCLKLTVKKLSFHLTNAKQCLSFVQISNLKFKEVNFYHLQSLIIPYSLTLKALILMILTLFEFAILTFVILAQAPFTRSFKVFLNFPSSVWEKRLNINFHQS